MTDSHEPGLGSDALDGWHDRTLSEDEARRFDERLARDPALAGELDLQRAIDASLQRSFAVPADAGRDILPVASAGAGGAPPRGITSVGLEWGWRAAAMAAAILLAFVLFASRSGSPAAPGDAVALGDGGNGAPIQVAALGDLRAPDLEMVYLEATDPLFPATMCNAPAEQHGIEETLAERCGQTLQLRPGAAVMFQGPFESSEWPTGTVLTGYPDGPDGEPSVLVAECEAELSCCLNIDLPDPSALHAFTWQVGDMLLTEITPRDQPRLLEYFEHRP